MLLLYIVSIKWEGQDLKDSTVINQVLILFLIIGVGYYGRKRNIINGEINKGLNKILLELTLPMMIVSSFDYTFSSEIMINIVKIFIYSLVIHIFLIIISILPYIKFDKDKRDILRFITIFSNCGFMGYPVLGSIYGKIGILYASIFNIPSNIFMWSFGVMLFSKNKKSKGLKNILLNPGILAVFIGVFLFIFSIKLPKPIYSTLKSVGDVTTPLSMIIIGAMIGDISFKKVFKEISIYYASFIRLVLVPLTIYFILNMLDVDFMVRNVVVIVEAMPAAALSAIFAQAYNKKHEFASQAVFITTLLSVITIPAVLKLLG